MNLKNKFRKFFTLSRQHEAGFTLIELIVVIVILGILGGVGTVGYSGYVKRANRTADEQLFAEIEKAIHMAYYSDLDGFEGGYISLSATENAEASSTDLANAMKAAFGDTWASDAKILCTDWTSAAYVDSSFHGQETALLGVVEDLTETLETLISGNPGLVGANFSGFLTDLDVDADDEGAVADAAVLYVARDSSEMGETQRQAVINSMANMYENYKAGDAIGPIRIAMVGDNAAGTDKTVAACAAYYAMVEGYCRYANGKGYTEALTALNNAGFGNGSDAKESVNTKVNAVLGVVMATENDNNPATTSYIEEYFNGGQAAKDAEAYLDVLNTVHSAQNDILNIDGKNLGDSNFYDEQNGKLEQLFLRVANGGALIFVDEINGKLVVTLPSREK